MSKLKVVFVLLLVSLIGIVVVLVFMRFGPGVSGDSVTYIRGARNIYTGRGYAILKGNGELEPISGFPPMYSLFLIPLEILGWDIYFLAGLMNGALLGVNTYLLMLIIYRTRKSLGLAILGGLLFISSDAAVLTHGWILSEPLYLTLMLLSILLLMIYFERREIIWIVSMAIMIGIASLARYIGVIMLPAIIIVVSLFRRKSWQTLVLHQITISLVALTPLVVWFARNITFAGSAANRVIEFRMIRRELAWLYLTEISSWFAPGHLPFGEAIRATLAVAIAIGLPVYLIINYYQHTKPLHGGITELPQLVKWVSFLYMVGHVIIILMNSFFLDAATTLSAPSRYLLPTYICAILFFLVAGSDLARQFERVPKIRLLLAGYTLLVIGFQSIPLFLKIREASIYNGYTGFILQNPDVSRSVNDINPAVPVVSNNPELIYYISGRSAYMRPIRFDPYQMMVREDYLMQLQFVQSLLDQGGIYVQLKYPTQEEASVIEDLDLRAMFSHANKGYFYTYGNDDDL